MSHFTFSLGLDPPQEQAPSKLQRKASLLVPALNLQAVHSSTVNSESQSDVHLDPLKNNSNQAPNDLQNLKRGTRKPRKSRRSCDFSRRKISDFFQPLIKSKIEVPNRVRRFLIGLLLLANLVPTLHYQVSLNGRFSALESKGASAGDSGDAVQEVGQAIQMALVQVYGALFLQSLALVLSQARRASIWRDCVPYVSQLALTGLMPMKAFALPNYPIMQANLSLSCVMTTLNVLYHATSTLQSFFLFAIFGTYLLLVQYQVARKQGESQIATQLGLHEEVLFVMPDSAPTWYTLLYRAIVFFYFCMVTSVAVKGVKSKRLLRELAKAQMQHFYEMVGFENESYVVMEVLPQAETTLHLEQMRSLGPLEPSRLLMPSCSDERGFLVTFISKQFHKMMLFEDDSSLEDLIFRRVSLRQAFKEQDYLSNSDSNDDEQVDIKDRQGKPFAPDSAERQPQADERVLNLKQLVDDWDPTMSGRQIGVYEVKSLQAYQYRRDESFHQDFLAEPPVEQKSTKRSNRAQVVQDDELLLRPKVRSVDQAFAANNFGALGNQDSQIVEQDEPQNSSPSVHSRVSSHANKCDETKIFQAKHQTGVDKLFVRVYIKQSVRHDKTFRVVQIRSLEDTGSAQPFISGEEANKQGKKSSKVTFGEQAKPSALTRRKSFRSGKGRVGSDVGLQQQDQCIKTLRAQNKLAQLALDIVCYQFLHIQIIKHSTDAILFGLTKLHLGSNQNAFQKSQSGLGLNRQESNLLGIRNPQQISVFQRNLTRKESSSKQFIDSKNQQRRMSIQTVSVSLLPNGMGITPTSSSSSGEPSLQHLKSLSSFKHNSNNVAARPIATQPLQKVVCVPEIESEAKSVLSSAKLLLQITDTAMLCKKLVDGQLDPQMDTIEGGPKILIRSVIDAMKHLLSDKQLGVRLKQKRGSPLSQDACYFWRLFRGVLFHNMLWAINNSKEKNLIFVELSEVTTSNGQIITKHLSSGNMQDEADSDRSNDLLHQSFMTVTVSLEGSQELMNDPDCVREMRRDVNYLLVRRLVSAVGGKMLTMIEGHLVVTHFILPMELEVIEAELLSNEDDKRYWATKNKFVMQQLKQQARSNLEICKNLAYKNINLRDQNSSDSLSFNSSFMKQKLSRRLGPSIFNEELDGNRRTPMVMKLKKAQSSASSQQDSHSSGGQSGGNQERIKMLRQATFTEKSRRKEFEVIDPKKQKNMPQDVDQSHENGNQKNMLDSENSIMEEEIESSDLSGRFQKKGQSNRKLYREGSSQRLPPRYGSGHVYDSSSSYQQDSYRSSIASVSSAHSISSLSMHDEAEAEKRRMQQELMKQISEEDGESSDSDHLKRKRSIGRAKRHFPSAGNESGDPSAKQKGFKRLHEAMKVPGTNQVDNMISQEARKSVISIKRLNTIREENSDYEGLHSQSQNSVQHLNDRSQKGSHRSLHGSISEGSIGQLEQERGKHEEPNQDQQRIESYSSYQMSAELDEGVIGGEHTHNMSNKYYVPIVGPNNVNPLIKSKKQGESDYPSSIERLKQSSLLSDQQQQQQQARFCRYDSSHSKKASDMEFQNDWRQGAAERRQKYNRQRSAGDKKLRRASSNLKSKLVRSDGVEGAEQLGQDQQSVQNNLHDRLKNLVNIAQQEKRGGCREGADSPVDSRQRRSLSMRSGGDSFHSSRKGSLRHSSMSNRSSSFSHVKSSESRQSKHVAKQDRNQKPEKNRKTPSVRMSRLGRRPIMDDFDQSHESKQVESLRSQKKSELSRSANSGKKRKKLKKPVKILRKMSSRSNGEVEQRNYRRSSRREQRNDQDQSRRSLGLKQNVMMQQVFSQNNGIEEVKQQSAVVAAVVPVALEFDKNVGQSLSQAQINHADLEDSEQISSHSSFESNSEDDQKSVPSGGICRCQASCLLVTDPQTDLIPIKKEINEVVPGIRIAACSRPKQALQRYTDDLAKQCCKNKLVFILVDLDLNPPAEGRRNQGNLSGDLAGTANDAATELCLQIQVSYQRLTKRLKMQADPPKIIGLAEFSDQDFDKESILTLLEKPLQSQGLKKVLLKYIPRIKLYF